MRAPSIGITKEGFPCIGITALAALGSAFLDWEAAAVVCFALCVFACNFFRDPERVVPQGDGLAVSPADGKIVAVRARPDPFSREERTCVSVFMNVVNVHVNRSPVAGSVESVEYVPGKFFNASLDKASTDNERCLYALRDTDGLAWTVVQIAGLVARRIVARVEPGDQLARGERFGMIKFGSRVDVYLPAGYEPAVCPGEHVLAGHSVLARKPEKQA